MKNTIKFTALCLVTTLLMGQTVLAAAGNHNIQALKLNPYDNSKGNDAMILANGIKNNVSDYTYSITNKTSKITSDDFYGNSDYIKYWASEGTSSGSLWAKGGAGNNASIELSTQAPKWAGGNLEFVFLGVCNQLNGSQGIKPRQIYAKAMRGSNAVRVISGYHDNAPSAADAAIAKKFIEYAKVGESVKSGWILANEYYKNDDSIGGYNASNYCVLTHSGTVQYSRIEGFKGGSYTRPGTSSKTILRFSSANPNGATELSSSELATIEVPSYALKGIPKDITLSAENVITDADGNKKSAIMDEISDTPLDMSDADAKSKGLQWLDNYASGLNRATVEDYEAKITPIIMSEIYEDDTESSEQTVAYAVNYQNQYEGIRISGEGYDAIVDADGVIAANAKWSDFEKVESLTKSNPVTYEQAKQLVNGEMKTRNTQDVDAMKGDISYIYDKDDDVYYPTWIFNGEDTTYTVNCLTGELN